MLDTPVLAEVLYQRLRPALVAGCFSTALLTASALYGIPVARTGTGCCWTGWRPYQNSNRVPVTIVDALLPDLADAAAVRGWRRRRRPVAADLTPLLRGGGLLHAGRRSTRELRDEAAAWLRAHLDRGHLAVLQAPPPDLAGAAGRGPGPAGVRPAQPHGPPGGPAGPRAEEGRARLTQAFPPLGAGALTP